MKLFSLVHANRPILFLRNKWAFAGLLAALILCGPVYGQQSLLEKKVSLELHNQSLEYALARLSQLGDFAFSYNPRKLPLDSKVSVKATREPIHSILDQLLSNSPKQYKVIGSHVIIQNIPAVPKLRATQEVRMPNPIARENRPPPPPYIVAGKLINQLTGKPISDVSLYDPISGKAAVSDSLGKFTLRFSPPEKQIELVFRHRFYQTERKSVFIDGNENLKIKMIPVRVDPLQTQEFTLESNLDINPIADVFLVRILINDEVLNTVNPKDELKRKFGQITLISPAGTNQLQTSQTVNRISLNVIGGYSGGVKGVEVGGLLNADRYDVEGVQLAGLGNVVGGKSKGLQVAGMMNMNRQSVSGVQLAGLYNWADSLKYGGQFSGFANVLTGEMKGVQFAGFANVSGGSIYGSQTSGFANVNNGKIYGLQLAGFANISTGSGNGAQISGFVNHAKDLNGIQIAGMHNQAAELDGVQVSGFLNISTKKVRGFQITSLLNIAHKVEGTQLAIFNYADSVKGIPIGFLSIVKHGYRRTEISVNEVSALQFSLKTGVKKFYNIFSGAIAPIGDNRYWAIGYGLGSRFSGRKGWGIQTELTAMQLNEMNNFLPEVNLLSQANLGLVIPIHRSLELNAGPSFRLHITRWRNNSGEYLSKIAPYTNWEKITTGNTLLQAWVGGRVGIML